MVIRTTLAACLLALAGDANADLAPEAGGHRFLSARITVSKGATVTVRPDPAEKRRSAPAPVGPLDVYVWRERAAPPLSVTEKTKPAELLSPGEPEGFDFTLAGDLFEIQEPRPAFVVAGRGSMRVDPAAVAKVGPFAGPLSGREAFWALAVSDKDARLLRSGPPRFTCNLGKETPFVGERYLLSWSRTASARDFADACVEHPESPQRAGKERLKALSEAKDAAVLHYPEEG